MPAELILYQPNYPGAVRQPKWQQYNTV